MSLSNSNLYESNKKQFTQIDGIILGNFTTYQKLDPMIINAFSDCPNATELNIFIDLYPMIKSIYNFTGCVTDDTSLVSNVLSMCVHYREFFRRKSVSTNIYIINSLNCYDSYVLMCGGYNDSMTKRVNSHQNEKFILNNLHLLKDICPYLPNIYFINSAQYESSVVMGDIINDHPDIPNLVISKDIYPVQLCGLFPMTSILIPSKKRENGNTNDESIILNGIDQLSFWNWFIKKRENKSADLPLFNSCYFTLLNALTRFPERNIKSIYNISKVIRVLNELVINNIIPADIEPNFQFQMKDIISRVFPDCNISSVEFRYKVLSVKEGLYSYSSSIEKKALQFEDRYNPEAVKKFNDVILTKNPVELDKL